MQPLVREVQRKHKGNRQKITEETMALYREHGVNQFGGCLPVLLQLPILFASTRRSSAPRTSSPLTAEQVASGDVRAAPQAALRVTAGARLDDPVQRAPSTGQCNLPQFKPEFSHFLPLNCQLITPIKLQEPVDTTISWLFGLDLARSTTCSRSSIGGFALSLLAVIAEHPAVRAGAMTSTTAERRTIRPRRCRAR